MGKKLVYLDEDKGTSKVIKLCGDAKLIIETEDGEKEPGVVGKTTGAVTGTVATVGKAGVTGFRKFVGLIVKGKDHVVDAGRTIKTAVVDAAAEEDARREKRKKHKAIVEACETGLEEAEAKKTLDETINKIPPQP